MADVVAVVPLKALSAAKGRLAEVLPPSRRRELAALMCARVLDACAATAAVARVLLVAGDAEAAAVADSRSAEVLRDRGDGLTGALARADAHLVGAAAVLVVAGDLPLLTAADLDAVCAAGAAARAVVIAPTADGGTGALLRRPGALHPCAFGPHSAQRHRDLAARAGVQAAVIDRPGLRRDVDTPADLDAVAAADAALRRWLARRSDYEPSGASAYPS